MVLEKLDDPLQVGLGEPIRQSRSKIKDVVIVDRTDPSIDTSSDTELMKTAKHFDLLSGGEQFRIALGLALALHRRVTGGAAGTIIVDEGFGALDSNRRDSLAQQMADTTGGILHIGLAQGIILCSHSSEVKERFKDHRWIIEKHGGVATVRRATDDLSFIEEAKVELV